ncbi:MAG TPA: hypothetical protein VI299_11425 [Polyangiales bacterium]
MRESSLLVLTWLALAGCGRSATGEPGSSNAAGAAATAGAAAVLSVVAGCKVQNNCGYGAYCNHDTGYCVVRKCSEGCPGHAVCNEGLDRCQDPPPPRVPSDRLPQDDRLANPPGTH